MTGPTRPRLAVVPGTPEMVPLWRAALGARLRRLRHRRRMTLTETADRAGISAQYLSEMERGVKDPSSEMIAAVVGALQTDLAVVLDLTARDLRGDRQQVRTVRTRGPVALAGAA